MTTFLAITNVATLILVVALFRGYLTEADKAGLYARRIISLAKEIEELKKITKRIDRNVASR